MADLLVSFINSLRGLLTPAPSPAPISAQPPIVIAPGALDLVGSYNQATVLPAFASGAALDMASILANQSRYQSVAAVTIPPWWFIAALHAMEASLNFHCHLANGDPLTARTVNVPAGRPIQGTPTFTWEYAAVDALQYHGFPRGLTWGIQTAMDQAERYNGLGYRTRGLRSPYLFGGTTMAMPGKFTSDHGFDPTAMTLELGVAGILKMLANAGAFQFEV